MDVKEWIETNGARLLGVTTLTPAVTRQRSGVDYHDVHVTTLRQALEAAYTAGYDARSAGLASAGGRAVSPRKARTSKRNGKAGGRPRGGSNRCKECGGGYSSLMHSTVCKGLF